MDKGVRMIHKRYAVRDANDPHHRNLGTFFTAHFARKFADEIRDDYDLFRGWVYGPHPYVVKIKKTKWKQVLNG